jgi:hypothetical protein
VAGGAVSAVGTILVIIVFAGVIALGILHLRKGN